MRRATPGAAHQRYHDPARADALLAHRALGGRFGLCLLLGFVLDLVLLGPQRREAIKRAHDFTDRVGGDAGVERCRLSPMASWP
jgi:hypothetical protein